MSETTAVSTEALLVHAHWVRDLARRLVRDPDLADDLVQDTWLEAVENPPRSSGNLRGWLATVLRRRLSHRAREEASRRRREASQQPRGPDQPDEMLSRLEAHQQLVAAVRGLPEPYRGALLLRYLEGQPPREIARRRNAKVSTVNSQLQRGLAMLRAEMDRRFGSRRAWIALITGLPRGGPTLLPWMIAMQTKLLIGGCLALILISTWFLWPTPAEGIDPAVAERTPRGAETAVAAATPQVEDRQVLRPPTPRPAPAAAAPVPIEMFSGRVLDAEGSPLPDMRVVARGAPQGDEQVISDSEGRFQLAVPDRQVYISVQQAGWTTVLEGMADDAILTSGIKPVVVAAPTVKLGGTVTDEKGTAVAGASLQLKLPEDLRTRMKQVMDRSFEGFFAWTTDERGGFELSGVPVLRGAEIVVRRGGFLPRQVPEPERDTPDMIIALERPRPEAGTLLGQVLDPFGAPVPGAFVSLGRAAHARTGEDGTFGLPLEPAGDYRLLMAARRGYLPARHELADAEMTGEAFVHLQFTEPTLSAGGRVVDDQGQPVANAWVWVDDPEVAAFDGHIVSVEAYLGGGATMEELMAKYMKDGKMIKSEAEILREQPTGLWGFVRSAADGSFELGGLAPRGYRIKALDSDTYALGGATVEAGGTTEVIVTTEGYLPELRARLIDHNGTPLSGVKVTVQSKVIELSWERYWTYQEVSTKSAESDERGRVTFQNINLENGQLDFNADTILPGRQRFPDDLGTGREWVIELDRRLHVRLALSSPEAADSIGAYDDAGDNVPTFVVSGEFRNSATRRPIRNGRTEILSVSDLVRGLILYKDGVEIERIPITLSPGIVNEIRW